MTIDQLSDKAKQLLTTALVGEGRMKGWIALTRTLGGGGYVTAGRSEERVYGSELEDVQRAIDELHDNQLIIQAPTGGFIVTPQGCLAAGWTSH